MIKRHLLIGILSLQVICSYAVQKSSITQYGITWTFDHSYECGQFVTGDWWVVGPVTIVSTTPLQTPGRNGSTLNPAGPSHGYDDRVTGGYNPSYRETFPLTVGGVNSLVTTLSAPETTDCVINGNDGWMSISGICSYRSAIKAMAVLTIVNAPVPIGTFRPSYIGDYNKEFFHLSDVDYNVLPHLPVLSSIPNTAVLHEYLDRPWLDHFNEVTSHNNYAFDNSLGYGRDMSSQISEVAACLMMNIPELNDLTNLMIQRGIEIYGGIQNDAIWPANGGHASGRKWPVLFAGKLLNHQGMLSIGSDFPDITFGEDCQTYYDGPGSTNATWGLRHCDDPSRDNEGLTTYRMCCTSSTWVGQMLTAMMLCLKDEWNHDAYFDYIDNWITVEGESFGVQAPDLIEDLWYLYRNNLPACIPHNGNITTGISKKTASSITMIPNPTTGILNLSVATEWTLKSIEGKMLETGTGKVVDLSKYANGVYIIVIGNKQEKIVKL